MKMIRKIALQILAPALLVFIACNAYIAISHLRQMQKNMALTLESSAIQANIAAILRDFTDMETGQRGYLLTENTSYLQPYTDARGRIENDFAGLRAGLANRADSDRSMESQLESLAAEKQGEMERSINFRQQGYRHRAFMLVDSNEGMEYMVKARELLSSLSMAESSRFARLDKERNDSLSKASAQIIVVNLCLLVLTACLFGLMRYHGQMLEQEAARSRQELVVRELQLETLTHGLSNQARSKTCAIEANARLLLENYGGFLPRQGHEYAEQIQEASAEMELLRQDLLDGAESSNNKAA